MVSDPYKVAVIGYGLSAKGKQLSFVLFFHIPLIAVTPEFTLYAIVQRHVTPENDAQKDHPGIKSYRSAEEMVNDATVDVAVISTPPPTHFDFCKLALEHGKHVVVEKPFTPTSKEASQLISIAKENKKLLTVYQNRRWDTDFLTLSKLLKEEALGRVVEFESHFDRHRPEVPTDGGWKSKSMPGGGAIYDLGTHLIDQVVVTFGLPDRITGFVGSQRQGDTRGFDDGFTVLLHYDQRGVLATVKASVVSPEVEQLRYWVRGEKGSYKKFHLDCQEDQLKAGKKPGDLGFGLEPNERAGTLTTIQEGKPVGQSCPNIEPVTYSDFYGRFAKALAGHGDVPVAAEGARDVIRLIELARLSSQKGMTLKVNEHEPSLDG